jgi:DNA polymerase-3 subunit beta
MKIDCVKDKLEEAVGKAEKIAGKNVTLPVLSGIYLDARDNNLSIKATNLDIGMSLNLPVKVINPGITVLPAHTFYSFLSSLTNDKTISLETKGETLEVKTASTDTRIKTLPSEDFPIIPELSDDDAFSLPARDLVFGLKSVIYAASVGSIKPELSSVAISYEEGNLVFATTDSFRLAEKKIRIKKVPHFKQILLPQKNALEIIRAFDKGEEEISISVEEHQIALRSPSLYIASRIIEGTFPDYRQVIPKDTSTTAVMLKQDLISSLKTSLVFSDSFNQLSLKVSPKGKIFEIESKNNTVGENVNALKAALEGEDIEINVNHRYFTDCFQSITTDSLSLGFSGANRPIVVQGVGDTSFLYLVMPMNK